MDRPRIDNHDDLQRGLASLSVLDRRLAAIHAEIGDPPLRRSEAGFAGLVSIIVAQQVSVASAAAIEARVRQVFDPLVPGRVASAPDEDFRAAGLSRPKIRTLRALATALIEGTLDLDAVAVLEPEAAAARLTAVHGLGPWSADIYLMFCLGDADAFAAGDLALREGARLAFGLPARPTVRDLEAMAEAWRPWRGVAARLLFAYYAAVKQGRVEPPGQESSP